MLNNYKKVLKDIRWDSEHDKQKDLYTAYLLMNTDMTTQKINAKACENHYQNFTELHDNEIKRIKDKFSI